MVNESAFFAVDESITDLASTNEDLEQDHTTCFNTSDTNELTSFYTDKIKYLESLVKKYKFDYLTNLMGKRDCIEKMDELFEEYMSTNQPYYFGLIDIDNLHNINRTHGYYVGDELIKEVAESLKSCFLFYQIYRISGDEFAVVVRSKELSLEHITKSLDKIKNITYYVAIANEYINPKQMFKCADAKITEKKKLRKRL